MITQPIQPQQPSFGLNKSSKICYQSKRFLNLKDSVTFANGKKLNIYTLYEFGQFSQKLYYLKDEAGNWLRSKLKVFKGNKVVKTLFSERGKNGTT